MPKVGGKSYSYWFDRLGIGEGAMGRYQQDLISSINTQTQAELNRLEGVNAMGDVPAATAEARLRGARYKGQEATAGGINKLNQWAQGINSQAWAKIMSAEMQEQAMEAQEGSYFDKVMSAAGQGLGMYAGYGLMNKFMPKRPKE